MLLKRIQQTGALMRPLNFAGILRSQPLTGLCIDHLSGHPHGRGVFPCILPDLPFSYVIDIHFSVG